MNPSDSRLDRQIIARYTDQPDRMPAAVRRAIEDAWEGRPVQLYALVDLDAGMRLSEAWLALGPEEIAVARKAAGAAASDAPWDVQTIPRRRVTALREAAGLSGSALTFLGEPGEPAL